MARPHCEPFENEAAGGPNSYGESLWWTAMVTTMGSEYWPQTVEGRVLCVFLALYAFGVFGYVTAALATFFVGRDADSSDAEVVGAKQLAEMTLPVYPLLHFGAVSAIPASTGPVPSLSVPRTFWR